MDPAHESAARVARLQAERDVLRARLGIAGPHERETLQRSIREHGEALAQALLTSDTAAQDLRLRAPRPAPGPLSPEAEARIQEFYRQCELNRTNSMQTARTERPRAGTGPQMHTRYMKSARAQRLHERHVHVPV